MKTLSSFSKFLLTLTLVGAGAVGTAVAAPVPGRMLAKAKVAAKAERANRPVQAERGNHQSRAQALEGPTVVAQAPAPTKARKFDRKERHAQRIATFDSNNNGEIDPAERLVMKKQRFMKLDANGDNVITLAELKAAKQAQREKRAEKRAMHPDKEGKKNKKARAWGKGKEQGKRGEARFAKLDSDGNGSVSWQEFSAAKGHGYGPMRGGRGPQGKGLGKGPARY